MATVIRARSLLWRCSLVGRPWLVQSPSATTLWHKRDASCLVAAIAVPAATTASSSAVWKSGVIKSTTRECHVSLGAHSFTRADYEFHSILLLKSFEKIDPEKVTLDAHFKKDLGLDSLDHVELISTFEDHFSVPIEDHLAEQMFTIRQIVDHCCKIMRVEEVAYVYPHHKAPSMPEI